MKSVIIADDEFIIAEDIKLRMNNLGYDVVATASSSSEVLSLAKKLEPDGILMDISMESKTAGIDACRLIKKENSNTIIVFISSYHPDLFKEQLKDISYNGFLNKFNFQDKIKRIMPLN